MAQIDNVLVQAMKALGWDADSDFPMANAENIKLLQEIDELTKKKQDLKETSEDLSERIKKVDGHVKIARSSIQHNMTLLNAFQMEALDESHKLKLAERERSKLNGDLKEVTKENENYTKFVSSMEDKLNKLHKKMAKETTKIQEAKTALAEWQQAMDDGNKGYQLIEKYFKADQQKALETDMKRKTLEREILKVRKEVINLYDEQKTLEQGIESIATLYRSAHEERRQLVNTWKSAVKLMTDREKAIIEGEKKLANFQTALKKKKEILKSLDDKLTAVNKSNRDIEIEMEALNKETAIMRDDLQETINRVKIKEQEIDLLERDLENLGHMIQLQRIRNKELEKQKKEKDASIQKMIDQNKRLEDRVAKFHEQNMNATQRLEMLEELIDAEEKLHRDLNKETSQINQLLFRAQQQHTQLTDEQKSQLVLNDGVKSTIVSVGRKVQELDKYLHRMNEANYEIGFKVMDIERELIKRQGIVVDPEEERQNNAYLAELDETYAKLQQSLHATEYQNKKLDDNMRSLTIVFNTDMKNLEEIKFKIKESESYCEGGAKILRNQLNQYQSMIVELSILKMKVNEFESKISKTEDKVYNLEKHRLSLNKMIKDRIVEIKSQTEILNLKKKHLNEEKSTLRADVGERKKHIEAMKAKFELSAHLMGHNEDGSLVTATQLRVANAQEKQMLLEEGNTLNEKVIKAEKDIKAMENTVHLINYFNGSYKNKVITKNKHEDANAATLKELQLEHCKSVETLKVLRQQAEKILRLINKSSDEKEKLDRDLESEKARRMEYLEALVKIQKEVADQKPKIQRAERELANALKSARQLPIGPELLALYDKDLDLRDLENRNIKALNQLCDLVEHVEEYGARIMEIMIKKGFKMSHQIRRSRSYGLSSQTSELSFLSSRSYGEESLTERSTMSGESLQLKSASISVVSLDFPSKKSGK